MSSFNVLWENALEKLETFYYENNDRLGFDNYIRTLVPECEIGNTLYLRAGMELQRELVNGRFIEKITAAVTDTASQMKGQRRDMEVKIITSKEAEEIKASTETYEFKSNTISLNPTYTFDTFVVGNSNKLANAASQAVADAPGHAYNPLFIYGGVGLGKTHLMHAIANQIVKNNPYANVIYVTSETFANELIEALRTKQMNVFKNKYRNADILLIDDIQFITRGPSMQEELFHTFNTLYEAGKQIILSSDKMPNEIPNLEERLLSRFHWGLLADVGLPDYETRLAILKNKVPLILKLTGCDFDIEDQVMHFIASKENSNIRDLEGALKRTVAYAKMYANYPLIDMAIAEQALKDFFVERVQKVVTPKSIIKNVCDYYDITEEDMLGEKKSREIAFPRQVAMYLLSTLTELPYVKTGELMGGRHHTTVMHAKEKIEALIKSSAEVKNTINDITVRIKE